MNVPRQLNYAQGAVPYGQPMPAFAQAQPTTPQTSQDYATWAADQQRQIAATNMATAQPTTQQTSNEFNSAYAQLSGNTAAPTTSAQRPPNMGAAVWEQLQAQKQQQAPTNTQQTADPRTIPPEQLAAMRTWNTSQNAPAGLPTLSAANGSQPMIPPNNMTPRPTVTAAPTMSTNQMRPTTPPNRNAQRMAAERQFGQRGAQQSSTRSLGSPTNTQQRQPNPSDRQKAYGRAMSRMQ